VDQIIDSSILLLELGGQDAHPTGISGDYPIQPLDGLCVI
jgi:hypothetical protein